MNRRRFLRNGIAMGMGTIIGGNQIQGSLISHRKFPKIDTEVHFWDLEWFDYPLHAEKPEYNQSFTLQSYLQQTQKAEITKILFVESGVHPDFSIEEADWAIAWAEDYPILEGVIARANMSDSVNFPWYLDLLEERPMIKGVRISLEDALLQPFSFIKNMNRLARTNLSLEFSHGPTSMPEAANLLERCPSVPCILSGMGSPDISGTGFRSWSSGIKAMAALPQVHFKISGLLSHLGPDWTLEQIRPAAEFIIEEFGFDRIMYGGNWPFFPQQTTYQDWSKAFEELLKPYSREDQFKCAVGNAERMYRL